MKESREKQSDILNELLEYRREVFCICLGFTRTPSEAEDLTQDVYLKAVERIHTLRQDHSAKSWLMRITWNACRDLYRRRRFRRFFSLEEWNDPGDGVNPEEAEMRNETERQLKKAMNQMPASLKDILVLREYGDLSYKEIGSLLSLPLGTVMSRLNRARKVLTAVMEDSDDN